MVCVCDEYVPVVRSKIQKLLNLRARFHALKISLYRRWLVNMGTISEVKVSWCMVS